MEHLVIWIQIAALIIGSGVLFDTYQMYTRYRQTFLKPMWWCYLVLNLSFLEGAFERYLYYNFFGSVDLFKTSLYDDVIGPLSGILAVGSAYFLIALDRSFRDRQIPKSIKWLAMLCLAAIIIRTVMGQVINYPSAIRDAMEVSAMTITATAFVICLVVLGRFAFAGQGSGDRNKLRAFRHLGSFYLVGCVLVLASAAFSGQWHGFVYASICTLLNLFPFYWYRRYLPRLNSGLELAMARLDLNGFCEKYGLSARQGEIIALVLRGKSNRDIADSLFIAPHTVKNHIYSVYQKLDVKSRFELVNLFLDYTRK